MSSKQAHLTGANCGPSIPPPIQSYHRPGRGRGRGRGCRSCLSCRVFKIVVAILLILGLGVLIFWLVYRPVPVKFNASPASLKQFNYSSSDKLLRYNLTVNLTLRNPNKNIGIHYDSIEAAVFFLDKRVISVVLVPFVQDRNTTETLNRAFGGNVTLNDKEVSDYNAEKKDRLYSIGLEFKFRIRYGFGKIGLGPFKFKAKCGFKVPLSSDRSLAVFGTTKCKFNF